MVGVERLDWYKATSGFWPRVRARALRAPVFLNSLPPQTGRCAPLPPYRSSAACDVLLISSYPSLLISSYSSFLIFESVSCITDIHINSYENTYSSFWGVFWGGQAFIDPFGVKVSVYFLIFESVSCITDIHINFYEYLYFNSWKIPVWGKRF
jgi:hypothetical protein